MARQRRQSTGRMWTVAAAGLLTSIAAGTLVAEYAVGQISPVARSSNWAAMPRAKHIPPRSGAETFTDDAPRATWGGPLYDTDHAPRPVVEKAGKDDWLNELARLEAQWAREDRARNAELAAASALPDVSPQDASFAPDRPHPEPSPTVITAPAGTPDVRPAADPPSPSPTS